jgi:hypothetical protein
MVIGGGDCARALVVTPVRPAVPGVIGGENCARALVVTQKAGPEGARSQSQRPRSPDSRA